MASRAVLQTILYAILALFAAAVLSSGAVYLLTRTVIPLVLVGIALCAYCILAGRIAVRVIGASRSRGLGHYLRMAIVPLALLAPVYVLCQLMLFLADGWGIVWKIPPLLRSGLRLPGAVVSGIGDFVSAVWQVFAGAEPAGSDANSDTLGDLSLPRSILAWAASSLWEIVVGVVSGIITAFVLRSPRR